MQLAKRSIIYLIFFLSNCTSLKHSPTLNIEVSNHIVNHVSEIPIVINNTDLTINLINAASAEQILLNFIAKEKLSKATNITIKCMSQCAIDLIGDLHKSNINNLTLVNAHLISNPKLKVINIDISASEAIKTGLPTADKANITISSSSNMLAVQKLLTGVNIIPGSGEFVYDTKIVYDQNKAALNSHNSENIADSLYNFKFLNKSLPNLKWAAPTIAWFATGKDMNVSNLIIAPGVEYRNISSSEEWHVGKYSRDNAHIISKDSNNNPTSGGTVNDESFLRYIDLLHSNNYKVMFYPMIFVDMPNKPWRGYIYGNNTEDIHKFFIKDKGYNEFILHYAKLLKGKVDAFVIGSEMQNLTQSIDLSYDYSTPERYPSVIELIKLAKQVKEILGPKVIVTYAGNWSEYHHDKYNFHHLDPLWTSENIDVVGIDAYLPITNKSMGDISVEEIKQGWKSGELWDYYYDNNQVANIMPEWGLKQIEYWWSHEHWSKGGVKSAWKPKMKPIWFTEFGFPSMHMATNTPNVFWNPKSVNGGVPKKSSGKPDFAIQMRAIQATLEYWQAKKNVVQNMFLWAWDVRPFPYYPQRLDIWSDGDLWSRGHWINGKIEPQSQVRLLPNAEVNILKTNADQLIIDGNHKIKKVIAKNIQYLN